jgi:hypothetical protein
MSAIPKIDGDRMEVLHETIKKADAAMTDAAVAEAIRKFKENMPINSIELNMLNTEIAENTDPADMAKVQYAFMKTIVQKAKVKADLYSKEAPYGLEDKELERLLVKSALSSSKVDRPAIDDLNRTLSTLATAREVFDAAAIKAKELSFSDRTAAATAYEIILLYAERKTDSTVEEKSLSIDPRAMSSMMSAA